MRPTSIQRTLNECINLQRPAFVWGPPGVGKSDVIEALAKQRKVELRDVRLAMMDPTDLKGLPFRASRGVGKKLREVAAWLQPDFLPTEGEGILFLDELNQAPPSVQGAAFQLILNRRLGDYTMPDGWAIVAAGNRAGDRSVVHDMPSALKSRFVHLDFEVHNEDWHNWADHNGISTIVTGYLRYKPASLHKFDPKTNSRAYPCPRTWKFVSDFVKSGALQGADLTETITGIVGEGHSVEFSGYMAVYRNLPTAADIIKEPLKTPVPDRPDGQFAAATMLTEHVNAKSIEPIMQYVGRLPIEHQVCFIRSVLIKNSALVNTKSVSAWIAKNSSVLV